MTDIVTYCDVNNCTECPRYGDDCDGRGEDEWHIGITKNVQEK